MGTTLSRDRKMVDVDEEKLRKTIKDKGLSLSEAGKKMGFSANYFHKIFAKGAMPESSILLMESIFQISREDFIKKEPPSVIEPEAETKRIQIELNKHELYKTIYAAICNAMTATLQDEEVQKIITGCMKEALK